MNARYNHFAQYIAKHGPCTHRHLMEAFGLNKSQVDSAIDDAIDYNLIERHCSDYGKTSYRVKDKNAPTLERLWRGVLNDADLARAAMLSADAQNDERHTLESERVAA